MTRCTSNVADAGLPLRCFPSLVCILSFILSLLLQVRNNTDRNLNLQLQCQAISSELTHIAAARPATKVAQKAVSPRGKAAPTKDTAGLSSGQGIVVNGIACQNLEPLPRGGEVATVMEFLAVSPGLHPLTG